MEQVIRLLEENQISYRCVSHPAVYTIEQMKQLDLPQTETVAKNLFLRDDRKKNYYLLTVRQDLRTDLKKIRKYLSCRPLSFASEDDLKRYLCLGKGEVTPLGLLNDEERKVKLILDTCFEHKMIGVHPNTNTATVFLNCDDLEKLIRKHGNQIMYMDAESVCSEEP